jgi:ApaG protein
VTGWSEAVTRGIRVKVKSAYLPDRSSPDDSHYIFAYRIRISNEGRETVQLRNREWIITDAHGAIERVVGDGVVGEQPALDPGQAFEDTSFGPLKTPIGSMHGSYGMVTAEGEGFRAEIAAFSLAVPTAIN